MIAVSNAHQPFWQPSQPTGIVNPVAHADLSAQQSPVPVSDQASKKVRGLAQAQGSQVPPQQTGHPEHTLDKTDATNNSQHAQQGDLQLITDAERQQLEELSRRDREVRAHEAAHLAAAGQHAASGAKYTFTRGPDGRSYAIGGSVDIDTSQEASPEATIRKADQIRRAALAPAEPSSQDRAVAAQATNMRLQAQTELVKLQAREKLEREDTAEKIDSTARPESEAPLVTDSNGRTINKSEAPGYDHSNAATSCEVCGGSHGSEGHVAANLSKVEGSYLGLIAAQSSDVSSQINFFA